MFTVKKETYKYKVRETSITGRQSKANRAESLSIIVNEMYCWAKRNGIIYNKEVLKKVLSYREEIFSIIFSQKTHKERIRLYAKCYRRIQISPRDAYSNRAINACSLIKELYNYLPGVLGYWYIRAYNKILNR